MINVKLDEVVEEHFESLRNKYQNNLEKLMKASDFFFNYVHLLYYKYHKINPNHDGSYIDSPDWTRNKKTKLNPINKEDNKCFQYTVTDVLNHKEIEKDLQRLIKIKRLINKYNWVGIICSKQKDDWKKIERSNNCSQCYVC